LPRSVRGLLGGGQRVGGLLGGGWRAARRRVAWRADFQSQLKKNILCSCINFNNLEKKKDLTFVGKLIAIRHILQASHLYYISY
jgi:hypothetical protein